MRIGTSHTQHPIFKLKPQLALAHALRNHVDPRNYTISTIDKSKAKERVMENLHKRYSRRREQLTGTVVQVMGVQAGQARPVRRRDAWRLHSD